MRHFLIVLSSSAILASFTGCLPTEEASGPGTIQFVDKDGVPFSGLQFTLESDPTTTLVTDENGKYHVEDSRRLSAGIGNEWWQWPMQTADNNFLGWVPGAQPDQITRMDDGTLQVSLPRILQFDGSADTLSDRNSNGACLAGSTHCVASASKYLAQAFVASGDMDVCYFGLGHFGLYTSPYYLHLQQDASGKPGAILASSATTLYGSQPEQFISSNLGGTQVGSICVNGASPVHLINGTTYWVVGEYPASFANTWSTFQGSHNPPASGLPLVESNNGVNWTNVPTLLATGFKSITVFVSQ